MLNQISLDSGQGQAFSLSTEIISQPEIFFRELPASYRKVIDFLLYRFMQGNVVFPSQETIGEFAGVTRQYCNAIIKHLVSLGVISKLYRHMRTCIYSMADIFVGSLFRARISHLFSSIRKVKLLRIFHEEKLTQYYRDIRNSYKCSSSSSILSSYDPIPRKGREVMKQIVEGGNPISLAIRSIESLKLNRWGQIRLSCFPDEAIQWADAELLGADIEKIRKPFNYFFDCALSHCTRNGINPDWYYMKSLEEKYHMPKDVVSFVLLEEVSRSLEPRASCSRKGKDGTVENHSNHSYVVDSLGRRFKKSPARITANTKHASSISPKAGAGGTSRSIWRKSYSVDSDSLVSREVIDERYTAAMAKAATIKGGLGSIVQDLLSASYRNTLERKANKDSIRDSFLSGESNEPSER